MVGSRVLHPCLTLNCARNGHDLSRDSNFPNQFKGGSTRSCIRTFVKSASEFTRQDFFRLLLQIESDRLRSTVSEVWNDRKVFDLFQVSTLEYIMRAVIGIVF